jgi:hypothetical protein
VIRRPSGRPIPPRALKRLIELDGFDVEAEDDYNWALAKSGTDEIVIVPKRGAFVAGEVCRVVLSAAPAQVQSFFTAALARQDAP